MEINEIMELAYKTNTEKGFWDKERNFGEALMLVTSELGEALEAHRKGKFTDKNAYELYFNSPHRDNPEAEKKAAFEKHVKDTVGDEIADAVIRLCDIAKGWNIDLEWQIQKKMEYNKTRPHKHGKDY